MTEEEILKPILNNLNAGDTLNICFDRGTGKILFQIRPRGLEAQTTGLQIGEAEVLLAQASNLQKTPTDELVVGPRNVRLSWDEELERAHIAIYADNGELLYGTTINLEELGKVLIVLGQQLQLAYQAKG